LPVIVTLPGTGAEPRLNSNPEAVMPTPAFQDLIPGNHCYGCGPDNPHGLRIKSRWIGEREARCEFQPAPHHCAGPSKYLNGGIIATLIDCHAVCTAIAWAYRRAGQEIGTGEPINFVTGGLNIRFRAPAGIGETVTVDARIGESAERKIVVDCSLTSGGRLCAEAQVIAVKVASDW
jgi:acyl-coenzyme A thioesterase PaaI-like protein